jgi:membrane protein YdbS with pleckstrin-like domain
MTYNLFSQASQQLNLLLVAQRSMVIITAFAIALITFYVNNKKEYYYLKFLVVLLLLYGVSIGIKSTIDFHKYMKDISNDELQDDDKKLVDSWKQWEYFNYPLVVLILLLSLLFIKNELFSN